MNNPETLGTFGTQDTGQIKNPENSKDMLHESPQENWG